jgi:tRNA A-37 threonylcarbamoyl transferase component Bud32
MLVKEFKGHSGCKVELHIDKETERKFVRKTSPNTNYNSRLKSQMKKQLLFRDNVLKTPEIYNFGTHNDKFYFDMEYIKGSSLSNFISSNSPSDILHIFEKITHFLFRKEDDADLSGAIEEKIACLKKQVSSKFHRHLYFCLDHNWSKMSSSTCHGDLTFENIIVYNSEVYLIDFLDSFVETKYIDCAKIFQDIVSMWSWRNSSSPPVIKCMLLYNKMCERLDSNEIKTVRRLLVMCILRIFPYADTPTLKILENRLSHMENNFEI